MKQIDYGSEGLISFIAVIQTGTPRLAKVQRGKMISEST